jgi:DNA-binding NtrC family response regulator
LSDRNFQHPHGSAAPSGTAKVLALEADPYAAAALRSTFDAAGYACETTETLDRALARLRSGEFGAFVADLSGQGQDMLAGLRAVKVAAPDMAVVVVGTDIATGKALECIRLGASDVLVKPFGASALLEAVGRAIDRAALTSREPVNPRAAGESAGALSEIVGTDPRLTRALELARAASRVRSTVLILGESGTGKSLLARAIHRASPRASMPFIELACGSIPETLLESELFGHVKGAFTGAIGDKKGRFAAADGGTLFLDEINSASASMQLKLLRVLQERKFEPVGSDETIEVDVRVIVASNQPLERLVDEGRFRQDLYYRVNVLPIDLPPLRERPADTIALAEHFLRTKSHELDRTILGFTPDAVEALQSYGWPGNIRELENAVERAVIVCDGAWIERHSLPERVRGASSAQPNLHIRDDQAIPFKGAEPLVRPAGSRTLADAMRDPERAALLAALAASGWNRSKAAASLGINRTTLYRKMRDLGLKPFGEVG